MSLPLFETDAPYGYAQGKPLCFHDPDCKGNRGRCRLGPVRRSDSGESENQSLTCETCGCTGDVSRNLTLRRK